MMTHLWMQNHRQLLLSGGSFLLLGIVLIIYLFTGRYVSTDNAYVKCANAAISANVPGHVETIEVHDNQRVKKGQLLFNLSDKSYVIAVNDAKAKLANIRLQILALKSSNEESIAEVQAAQNNVNYQQQEYARQQKLAASGISSQMQLNKTTNAFNNAVQQLAAQKQHHANILAQLDETPDMPIDNHPIVQAAQAALDQANLNLSYTKIHAPMDGIVTKVEQVQVGDYIQVGAPVFALISTKDVWVDANFKETQITYMLADQKVRITIDAYPNTIFSGHVASISPGTGSTFSLLPPENASGNWVKIVQRLPVRIAIDNNGLLLASGLSATVTVDTLHNRLGRFFS